MGKPLTKDNLLSMSTILAQGKYIIITGGAGSGKSTLLRYIAWLLGRAIHTDQPQLAYARLGLPLATRSAVIHEVAVSLPVIPLPVLVPLNEYASYLKQLPASADPEQKGFNRFITWWIEERYEVKLPKNLFQVLSSLEGSLILLLDGLDEVFDASIQREIKERTQTLVSKYRAPRVILTCRTVYSGLAIFPHAPSNLQQIRLDTFVDDKEIKSLVHRASEAIDSQNANRQTSDILAAVERLEHYYGRKERLICSPLWVRSLIITHFLDKRHLPEQRATLYENATQALFGAGYSAHSTIVEEMQTRFAIDTNQRQDLEQKLAFLAMGGPANHGLEFSKTFLDEVTNPERAVAILESARGVIYPTSSANYAFIHYIFVDYMVARYLASTVALHLGKAVDNQVSNGEIEKIINLLGNGLRTQPHWRERILLMIGCLANLQIDIKPTPAEKFLLRLAHVDTSTSIHQLAENIEAKFKTVEVALVGAEEWPELAHVLDKLALTKWLLTHPEASPQLRASAGRTIATIKDPRPEISDIHAVEFCYVPPGAFLMGENRDMQVNHQFQYGFWLARYPITVAQFARFIELSNDKRDNRNAPGEVANYPATHLSWLDAQAFCVWLTEYYQVQKLLPPTWKVLLQSEAEWEKGARGGLQIPIAPFIRGIDQIEDLQPEIQMTDNDMPQRIYPWGNPEDHDRANSGRGELRSPNTVGCFPKGASPYGCEEMSGNVAEWTRSIYTGTQYNPDDERASLSGKLNRRALRGGSFLNNWNYLRCSYRDSDISTESKQDRGFRIVLCSQ